MPQRISDFNFNQKIRKAKKDPKSVNYSLMFKRYSLTERQWRKLLSVPDITIQWSWLTWGETQEFTPKVIEMILNSTSVNPPINWVLEQVPLHKNYLTSYIQKLIDDAVSYPIHPQGCCSFYDEVFRTEHSPKVQSKYILRELSLNEGFFSPEEVEDYIKRGILMGIPNGFSPALTRHYMLNFLRESKNWHQVETGFTAANISDYLKKILPQIRNFYFLKLCLEASAAAASVIIHSCKDLPKEIIDLVLEKIDPKSLLNRTSYSWDTTILDNFLSKNILTSEQIVLLFKLIAQIGGADPKLSFNSIIQLIHQIQPAFTSSFLTDQKEEKRNWARQLLSGPENITFPEDDPIEKETDSEELEENSSASNAF